MPDDDFRPFIPLDNPGKPGFGIQPMGPSPLGGDIHDGFNFDDKGNISGGHTTARIPGGQDIKMPWDPKP